MESKAFPGPCREVQRALKHYLQFLHVLLQGMLFFGGVGARSFSLNAEFVGDQVQLSLSYSKGLRPQYQT